MEVKQYRIYCTTDNKYITSWNTEEPTICPENNTHSIDTNATVIINTISKNNVIVEEETIPTGGNFASRTITISAIKNTKTNIDFWWPYPISALISQFNSAETHRGDNISMYVAPDTIIGVLTLNISQASSWKSQNYTVGEIVTYTHSIFGERVYTCISNTINNENPSNITYWKHGLEISVNSTVIQNVQIGYYLKLDDGIKNSDLLLVVSKDIYNNKVYVENNINNSYAASTPTYIKKTVSIFKEYHLGEPCNHVIGESKIGGSYIPTDTIIRVIYDNKSIDTDKTLIGRVEYLY